MKTMLFQLKTVLIENHDDQCELNVRSEEREGGLQLAEIGTKNVSEPDITPRMKYIMVRLKN